MSAQPPIVDLATWEAALSAQQQAEDTLFEHILAAAASRRRLPMTPLSQNYTVSGPDGDQPLADVFGNTRQLVIYHFMYAPEWDNGCPHCTQYAVNQGHGINHETEERDTRYVLASRAPYPKLAAWAEQNGISTPWYSISMELAEEMGMMAPGFGDTPGINVLFKANSGDIYRSYSTAGRMVETTMPASGILRLTPYGMQEHGEESPEGWPQRFDSM